MSIRAIFGIMIAICGSLTFTRQVHAQTFTVSPTSASVSYQSRTIPRDRAVGTIEDENPGTNMGLLTFNNVSTSCVFTRTSAVSGTLVPGYTNVYQSGVPGIGVRFQHTNALNGGFVTAPHTSTFTIPISTVGAQNYMRASIVVTGPITTRSLTGAGPSMTLTFTNNCGLPTRSTSLTATGSPTATFTAQTCSVTTPNVNVTLPSIPATSLRPVGTAGGNQSFSIALNCATAGLIVGITLTDSSDPANRTDLLGLMPASTAQGVKLRVSRSGTPVAFGADSAVAGNPNQIILTTSANAGTPNFVFATQYVSTGTVVPGSVNARATFTMSYQ